jgi:hypothetical protein
MTDKQLAKRGLLRGHPASLNCHLANMKQLLDEWWDPDNNRIHTYWVRNRRQFKACIEILTNPSADIMRGTRTPAVFGEGAKG